MIDISQPEEPKIIASIDTPGWTGSIYISGNYAYLGVRYRPMLKETIPLAVIDISQPAHPQMVTTFAAPGHVHGVYVAGRHAYATYHNDEEKSGGLAILDITEPKAIRLVGTLDTPANSVYASGNYVYLASSEGIAVADVSQPEKPQMVGRIDTPSGSVWSVSVMGNYAYLRRSNGSNRLAVVDIHAPQNPKLVGEVQISGSEKVVASGSHAYIAGDVLGIVDISLPEKPRLVGQVDIPGYALDVHVSNGYAYVANYEEGGLEVIDISNPETPQLVGSADTTGKSQAVFVSGHYAYVADDEAGLEVIDVSQPENPKLLGHWKLPGRWYSTSDVDISGNYAYITVRRGSQSAAGLAVVDVSQPEHLQLVRLVPTIRRSRRASVSDGYVYVFSKEEGLVLIKDNWIEASIETPGFAQDVAVSGEYIYVADASELSIFRFQKPKHATSAEVAE